MNPDLSSESLDGEEEWEAISYEMVCQILDHHLDSHKLPCNLKHEVQVSISDVSEANSSIGIKPSNIIDVQLNEVKLFHSITPSKMAEYQKRCTQLSVVYEYVANNHKPKLSETHHIRSKPIRHHHTFTDDDETQQLVLPVSANQYYNPSMMTMVIKDYNV